MYLIARGTPFGLGRTDVYLQLAGSGDLLMTTETNPDGSPNWEAGTLADPRGCDTETEWQMCRSMIETLILMRDVAAESGLPTE